MKKLAFGLFLTIMISATAFGQRFAYIDSEYILDKIPEYQAAQKQINQLSVQWQNEIETQFAEIDKLYRAYQSEAVLLPEDIRRQREEQIIKREREAKELQMKRFGSEGDLFQRRAELVKPIQDQIFEAVQDIATRGNYAVIFDKSAGSNMIFSDVRFDLSDDVLEKMGYRR
jgi:outer membrane protein